MPIHKGIKLSKQMTPTNEEDKVKIENKTHAQVLRSFMEAMLCTRPNISYAVSLVSRFQSDPRIPHWLTIKRILTYIKDRKDLKLTYQNEDLNFTSYCDPNFVGEQDDRKSISCYIFILQGAIS